MINFLAEKEKNGTQLRCIVHDLLHQPRHHTQVDKHYIHFIN